VGGGIAQRAPRESGFAGGAAGYEPRGFSGGYAQLAQAAFWPDAGREAAPTRFPFTATCVLSSNDPFGSLERGQQQAAAWGANSVEIGPRGHINGESGLGDWPQGHELLRAVQQKSQAHWLANTLAATSAT
jgi:hypothetical protein